MHGLLPRPFLGRVAAVGLCLAAFSGGAVSAADRSGEGFLTSTSELRELRGSLLDGSASSVRRYRVNKVVDKGNEAWPFGQVGARFGVVRSQTSSGWYVKRCVRLSTPTVKQILPASGSRLYAKALAYNLTGDTRFAKEARDRLMDFARSWGFDTVDGRVDYSGDNQCAFDIAMLVPLLVETATLLESYPGWLDWHKRSLQKWLAGVPYRTVSATAATRKNNWGTASAFASWAIAHYLRDSDLTLTRTYPRREERTPELARRAHLEDQFRIIGDVWPGDTRCARYGAQWHGGFPNELRRGSTGCNGSFLQDKDSSYDYQLKTVSHLVFHAEALRRVGNDELYARRLDNGTPLIRRAIEFVIDNPEGRSHDWRRYELGVLRAASQAYADPAICAQLAKSEWFHIEEGRYMPYYRVVHEEACPGMT